MNIRYIGSTEGFNTFKKLLAGQADISSESSAKDCIIFEVSSLDILYKIPKRSFGMPVFFYVTTPNKTVISSIKDYHISGIFFPPLNSSAILSKIKIAVDTSSNSVNELDYDTLRIKIIAKAENIPTLPAIAQELIALTSSNSQAQVTDITSKIKTDQGIAAKVIKLVNSPFYGVRQEIASIDRATTLLGFSTIKNIALAISLDQYYQKPFNMFNTTGQAIWQHAYNVALISAEIGKYLNQDYDALYMAGLLHDIGKVVLADFLVKEVSNEQDERKQIGCTHSEIGGVILNKWAVAPVIVEAVKRHHSPKDIFDRIVYTANQIDYNPENTEAFLEELSKIYPIKNIELLAKTLHTIISDKHNEE